MKKYLFFLLLLAMPAYAPLTLNQVNTVRDISARMLLTVNKLSRLANTTYAAMTQGNNFTLDFSTQTYSLSASQQQDIVNYYQDLKAQLQAQLNALP